jgi:hypothetical protein
MATARNGSKAPEVSATPLADFFWIAGLDGQDLLEAYARRTEHSHSSNGTNGYGFEPTIEEDKVAEIDTPSTLDSSRPTSPDRKHDSFKRLSKLSDDARSSILSLNSNGTSKRSSAATIRAVNAPGVRQSTILNDVDFDRAMNKFAKDRESFFLDLNFAAGAVTKPSEPKKPRQPTQKIIPEEIDQTPTRGFGSIRRHMSFKEMSSMKRQPSVARKVSTRTSRRASNYNSVIPQPEALNTSPDLHPLKRKFAPVLLDRYPQRGTPDESKRRGTFPDYVPMFAFPNDINVVSSDTRPRSTWHGFAMTASDNSRLYGICIIVWIPMNQTTANELERSCEEWRQANMTDAERELAASLAERLAMERANLSKLLTELPQTQSGSDARDRLEDDISEVEEKINVMAEMLRPLRHGASSKIEGLTERDSSGIWVPRAYGILGKDGSMTSFWKEWLRAVVVPMSDGAILRIPASSPKVGMWQPLERYVVNLCTEAPSPISSSTQTEIAIRELRLYARKTAENELPGSRNIDLYPLFRAMSIPNIMMLFEYVLAESRIILLSSHTSMLQLVSRALVDLLWPLQWTGVFIPVLPARLVQTLEAPCPYICGIERRYENVELPDDDFVLVDLDQDEIRSPSFPTTMPKQQRRKLQSLLQLAAPHHYRYGVATGPPLYAVEAFAFDTFASENMGTFNASPVSTNLAKLVGLTSTAFGASAGADTLRRAPVFNAFLQAGSSRAKSAERPTTANTTRTNNGRTSQDSPITANFPPLPGAGLSPQNMQRNDSGYALQASLREKRSGHFDSFSRSSNRSNSISKRVGRRPSIPFTSHNSSPSTSTTTPDSMASRSNYAPSTYAQSTLAASTIMPNMLMQPIRNTDATSYVEGHCLNWNPPSRSNATLVCAICDDPATDGNYRCSGCGTTVHGRCAPQIAIFCSAAFYPDQIRAAFARCFASLFFTYRKYLRAPSPQQRKSGLMFKFNMDDYIRSLPQDVAEYTAALRETQSFNEFISEREVAAPSVQVAENIRLFDAIVLAKRDRGKPSMSMSRLNSSFSKHNPFSSRSSPQEQFLQDTTEHLWRTATAPITSSTNLGDAAMGREYREVVSRVPGRLEEGLMKEPRMIHGVPRISERMRFPGRFERKGVAPPSREGMGPNGKGAPAGLVQGRDGEMRQEQQGNVDGKKEGGERDMRRAALRERMNGLSLNPS